MTKEIMVAVSAKGVYVALVPGFVGNFGERAFEIRVEQPTNSELLDPEHFIDGKVVAKALLRITETGRTGSILAELPANSHVKNAIVYELERHLPKFRRMMLSKRARSTI